MSRVYLSISKLVRELEPESKFIDVIFSRDKVTNNKFNQTVIIPLAICMNNQVLTYSELVNRFNGYPHIQFNEANNRRIIDNLHYQLLRISSKQSEYNNIQYYKSIIKCFDAADDKEFMDKIVKTYNDSIMMPATISKDDSFDEEVDYNVFDFI